LLAQQPLRTACSAISKDAFNSRSGGIDGRPTVLYIASNRGDSCASAASAKALMRRSGCPSGTRCSGLTPPASPAAAHPHRASAASSATWITHSDE